MMIARRLDEVRSAHLNRAAIANLTGAVRTGRTANPQLDDRHDWQFRPPGVPDGPPPEHLFGVNRSTSRAGVGRTLSESSHGRIKALRFRRRSYVVSCAAMRPGAIRHSMRS